MSQPICVRIPDEDIWMRFKERVLAKYGRLHGTLGYEVQRALELAMEEADAHTRNEQRFMPPGQRRVKKITEEISRDFKPGDVIERDDVERAMYALGLGDKRTHKKYVEILEKTGILVQGRMSYGVQLYTWNPPATSPPLNPGNPSPHPQKEGDTYAPWSQETWESLQAKAQAFYNTPWPPYKPQDFKR